MPPLPPHPKATGYVPPPWAAALAYELPSVVHIGQILHRSPTMVVAVKSADVHSTGCSVNLSWLIRRGKRPATGLLFGVQFPDGAKASTGTQGPHGLTETGGQLRDAATGARQFWPQAGLA